MEIRGPFEHTKAQRGAALYRDKSAGAGWWCVAEIGGRFQQLGVLGLLVVVNTPVGNNAVYDHHGNGGGNRCRMRGV